MAVQRDKVIASAEKLVARGKIEPAIKEYERLLDDNPNDVNTLNRIGDLWVRINRNDEAVKVFGRIADHYSKDGFFLKAIAIYKKINKLDPSKLEVYAKLADLYAKQGLAMEAKSQYQVLADYYLKHGEPGNALGIYKKISELDPNSINVHVKLADLYAQSGQPAEALKEYDRVGRMLLKRGMLDEAVQVFKKALKNDPRNTELVDSLVTALLEAKDYENARQIVETALEANRDNVRLLAMLGKILVGKGDFAGARSTLERALSADPNEPSVREALGELHLRQSDADHALEVMVPLVEKAMGRGERNSAIELLNRILRVDSGHTPTLDRLVAAYQRLNEETNILAAMNSLAEAYVAKMKFEDAAKVLESLIAREPQNSQHRTKLQYVRSQMGGVDTMPTRAKKTAPVDLPPMEIDEPAPSFDLVEESAPSLSLDLDESPPIEIDFATEEPAIEPSRPAVPPPPPSHLVPAVEMAAESLEGEDEDDLDFITEHLTEAEVFAKYGLAEKAAEHLRAVLDRAPRNLTAHERLLKILLEEGDDTAGRSGAQAYIAVLDENGDTKTIQMVKDELVSRGISVDPSAEALELPEPPPAVSESVEAISLSDLGDTGGEIRFDLSSGPSEIEFEIETEAEPAPEPEPVAESGLETEIEEAPVEILEPLPEPVEPEVEEVSEAAFLREEPAEETAEPLMEIEESVELAVEEELLELPEVLEVPEPEPEPTAFEPVMEVPEPEVAAFEPVLEISEAAFEPEEAPFFGVEGLERQPELEELPLEEIGEIDFYIEQDLFDEARAKLDSLLARFPDDPNLETRRVRIEEAAAAAEARKAAAREPLDRPAVLSRAEIETELLSAIPDDDEDVAVSPPAPPPPARVEPAPAISAAIVQEENLFADEDNFFDLAAELESELTEEEEPIALAEEEQSLEEIFKEFKKGVEQQLDSEDYDTHYNLGIAYKEMGLIDEAIGEFQLASKDPKRAVECASMLGLCFLEKGMPQLAIKWYRKGIEIPEISEEEHLGLLYDLGVAYQEVGDTENAQKALLEVYGMNTNYRDVVLRIKQLEDARK